MDFRMMGRTGPGARLSCGAAVLAALLLAGCTGQPAPGPRPEDVAIYLCTPELPPDTPCIEPAVRNNSGGEAEPILEPDVVVEEPMETDYEGPRALQ